MLGYFGGVAWAICVARTCQLYPKAAAGHLVTRVFKLFNMWKWPMPVMLDEVDGADNWRSNGALVPVITPVAPTVNTTFNMTATTLRVYFLFVFRM